MTSNSNQRLPSDTITADRTALAALGNLSDYNPLNAEYAIATLQQLEAAMLAAQQAEIRIRHEADLLREQAIATAHAFHRAMKGARAQIVAQYGDDSVALHAVGLKKRSERKRPTRRPRQAA